MCCLQGKVRLPLLQPLPPALQALYDGTDCKAKSFRENIRQYNATNAFTSLGAKLDDRVLRGVGPKPFTIHGELRHRTGALLPNEGQEPVYSQLYIYDPITALTSRSRRNPDLDPQVLKIIQDTLHGCNPFVSTFRNAHQILAENAAIDCNIKAHLHYDSKTDRRRYNLPSVSMDQIAIILPGEGGKADCMRDIVLYLKEGNELMRISECHPAYLPLHYVLFFPNGELGWAPEMMQWDVASNDFTDKRLTQMQYYSCRIFERHTEYSPLLHGHKLFQEFLVDAWASTEQNRLNYQRLNQETLRADLYTELVTGEFDELASNQIGQVFILPSSFIGSPRYMSEIFQDSMAITRFNKHPDIFLTMTANPKWLEVTEALKPNQDQTQRADLIARIFDLKRKALMREVYENGVLGRAVAHVYTIEFQKRGLPHMHLLIYLKQEDKIRTPVQVDQVVSAEFPDPVLKPALFGIIKRCMVHGPCGINNPNASCMEDGKCTKRYPRAFVEETILDQNGYPLYRRRNTRQVYIDGVHEVDNRNVVPYNPYLSEMFDCHINVEVCGGVGGVKYIHKYIYKGGDRSTYVINGRDEIQQYLDSRYISPPEAVHRLLGFSLHEEFPNVVRLALHLPGMHRIIFKSNESLSDVVARGEQQKSTLLAFFECCASNSHARAYTYQEFPQHFVWDKQRHMWKPRQRGFAIGRMYFASPNSGERFYLRLLLTVVKGPQSYQDLRTVNGSEYSTFKGACVARGLLEDDGEWILCLEEASVMKTGYQLRRLFSIILLECSPIQPDFLWNRFAMLICDDLAHTLRNDFQIPSPTETEIIDYGLFLLNQILLEAGKNLIDFPPMPLPRENWRRDTGNRLICEHDLLRRNVIPEQLQMSIDRLNAEQRNVYNTVVDSVINSRGKIFFLNGAAGTGKTFVYNTIAAQCRKLGHIVVSVASAGIASLLLVGGRTAHSTFAIPLDVMDDSVCGIKKQSLQAELFNQTKLIIWDEVPMQHKFCVEAVDRMLRDICNNNECFGGITVILGGDFRQILPVIPKGVREQIVGASLRRSHLWSRVQVLLLVHNMRLENTNSDNANFALFLLKVRF
jgi:hypothetical protein